MDKELLKQSEKHLSKRRKKRVISCSVTVLVLIVMVLTVSVMKKNALANTKNLADYITSVENSSAVQEGDKVNISSEVYFSIPEDDYAESYVFNFPGGMYVPDELCGREYTGTEEGSDVPVFTYRYERNTLTVVPDRDYIANHTDVGGYIKFYYACGKDLISEDKKIEVQFKDKVTIDVVTEEIETETEIETEVERIYDIRVEKRNGDKVTIDGNYYLEYLLEISSEHGTYDRITVRDTLTELTNITRKGSAQLVSVKKDGADVAVEAFEPSDNVFTMTLPGLSAGERYQVVYRYEIENIPVNVNACAKNTVEVKTVGNAEWEYSGDRADLEKWYYEYYNPVEKWGNYDSGAKEITWTIRVNNSKSNIAGKTLYDEMFGLEKCRDLKIEPEDNNYEINTNAKTITFKAADGKVNTQTYTITYKQIVAPTDDPQEAKNRAEFDGYSAEASVWYQKPQAPPPPTIPVTQKEFVSSEEQGGSQTAILTWRANIHVPQEGLAEGTAWVDVLQNNTGWEGQPDVHWYTREQLLNIERQFKASFGDGNVLVYAGNSSNPDGDWKAVGEVADEEIYRAFMVRLTSAVGYDDHNEAVNSKSVEYSSTVDLKKLPAGATWIANAFDNQCTGTNIQKVAEKKDAAAGTTDSTVHRTEDTNELSWEITANVNAAILGKCDGKLIVKDTLPEGLKLKEIQYKVGYGGYLDTTIAADGAITAGKLVNGTVQNAGDWSTDNFGNLSDGTLTEAGDNRQAVELRFNLKASDDFKTVAVKLVCEIPEDELKNITAVHTKTYANTATVVLDREYQSNTQTQEFIGKEQETVVTPETGTQALHKIFDENSDIWSGKLHYIVSINGEKKNLLADEEGTLTLTDTMNYTVDPQKPYSVQLLMDTLALYRMNEAGEYVRLDNQDFKYTYDVVDNGDGSYTNLITLLELEDETAYILEYTYQIYTQYAGALKQNLVNEAELSGVDVDKEQENVYVDWVIYDTVGHGYGKGMYKFIKVEMDESGTLFAGRTLEGAVFRVYRYNGTDFEATGMTYTTNSNGEFVISPSDKLGEDVFYQPNTAYYIMEEEAPKGYILPDEADRGRYCFYMSDSRYDLVMMPEGFTTQEGVINLSMLNSGVVPFTMIGNERTQDAFIRVEKKWMSFVGSEVVDFNDAARVDIALERKVGDGAWETLLTASITPAEEIDEAGRTRYIWKAAFDNLAYTVGGEACVYRVTELGVYDADGSDCTDKYEVSYDEKNVEGVVDQTITITNQSSQTYELPETGGTGTRALFMLGTLFAGVAGIYFVSKKRV